MTQATSFVLIGSPFTPGAPNPAPGATCACGRPVDECDLNDNTATMAADDVDAELISRIFDDVVDYHDKIVGKRRRALRAQSKAEAVDALSRIMEDVAGAALIVAELVDEVHNAVDDED